MARRVVVSGIGVITSLGEGRDALWTNLLQGRCGVSPVTAFETARYGVHNGAEIRTFAPSRYVRRLPVHAIGRASQFAIAASRLALEDGGIDRDVANGGRVGVVVGTTSGEPHYIEALDDALIAGRPEDVDHSFLRGYPSHMLAAHVAAEFRFSGVAVTISTACAAGNGALAYASDAIRAGTVDVAIAGGADVFSRITYAGFSRLGAIAPDRCQPFDLRRQGMIPGEGAAMLLLESHDRAVARGARIYAELAGYGLSCDAHHMTSGNPAGDGPVRAMQMALAASDVEPGEVSYISAHGTGTLVN